MVSKYNKKPKKTQHLSDYKIKVTYKENTGVKFDNILNGEEFKEIVRMLLIQYS